MNTRTHMPRASQRHLLGAALLSVALVACGGSPAPSTGPTAAPAASSYADFAAGFCTALVAMTRAIGNPDTGADSDLSFALEQAVERGDIAGATEVAGKIRAELGAARQEASRIAGWADGAPTAEALDRFLAAFELYVTAFVAAAPQGVSDAQIAAQQAFEGAGAMEAWIGMIEGVQALALASDDPTAINCDIPADPRNPDE